MRNVQPDLFTQQGPKLEVRSGFLIGEWFVWRIGDLRWPDDRPVAGPFNSKESAQRAIDERRVTCL